MITDDIDTLSLAERCRKLAAAYVVASESRGRWMAWAEADPSNEAVSRERFEAGIREADSWRNLMAATGHLIVRGEFVLAAEIRQEALHDATRDGIRAMRIALREVAA